MKKSTELVGGHKKIIVFGELGSGKSEISINLAMNIRKEVSGEVSFFDMDQTKPMFRSREQVDEIRAAGITFNIEKQFMDAPTIPAGVKENLANDEIWTVMDVGGSSHGAYCMGQFAEAIAAADSIVLYMINPYRSFSGTTEGILQTMYTICNCAGLYDFKVVCNPFLGPGTTAEDIIQGRAMLEEILKPTGIEIYFNAIADFLWDETHDKIPGDSIKIKSYLRHIPG